ncbi:MAG TPA: tRNA (adenosine(37)-N6)-dimethylallyltransferase MiaA [Steroidobacteraceae bacterium]|nr:tRNA (adenosine(37)-N6)-dimethylallyltransferase MiaA [Steroidobacteraceae bacterium]
MVMASVVGPAQIPVVVLTGPTGSGKSAWAERLAGELPVEIVSVDSALVYRGMDIGTAKPSREVRARIPHHLIDILEPTQSYSAGQFVADALPLLDAIRARGRIPLLVGGTMLYLRALLHGIAELPQGSRELRRSIDARAAREGWPALHAQLARLDAQAAARIHPNDAQRIQRALEVCEATGEPLSRLQRATRPALSGPVLRYALMPEPRQVLHARIAARFHAMMEQGFLGEVRRLLERGDLTAAHACIRAVGYRQLWAHLAGETALEEAVARGIAATRQLAKRQLTWLRSDSEIKWVDVQAIDAYADFCRHLRTGLPRFNGRETPAW